MNDKNMINHPHLKRAYTEPDKVADEVAQRLEEILGRPAPVQRIRNSQILTALIGAIGLALFIIGIEKVFGFLPGPFALLLGFLLLALSGALLKKL